MFNIYSGIFLYVDQFIRHNTLVYLYLTIFSFFRRQRHAWLNVMAELQETIVPVVRLLYSFNGCRTLDAGD